MSIGKTFAPYNTALSALSDEILESITEVIFCWRDGIETVCVVTPSVNTLQSIIGYVPDTIRNANTRRYFVDLESVGTDKLRLYADSAQEGVSIEGYYFDTEGQPVVKKVYKRDGKNSLLVDYFDAEGNVLESNAPEITVERSSWLGNSEAADKAEECGKNFLYLKKVNKNQCYLRVYG